MKPVLEPGTYTGRWTLEGELAGGMIELGTTRRPVCWLMGASASYSPGLRRAEHSGALRGHLENGYEAVLVDAHAAHPFRVSLAPGPSWRWSAWRGRRTCCSAR